MYWELIFWEFTFWEVDNLGIDIPGVDILGVDILRLTWKSFQVKKTVQSKSRAQGQSKRKVHTTKETTHELQKSQLSLSVSENGNN